MKYFAFPAKAGGHLRGVTFETVIHCLVLTMTLLAGSSDKTFAQSGSGLRAEYYNSKQLGLVPTVVQTDPTVNFDWGANPPNGSLPPDRFSVRWVGKIRPPQTGTYTFATFSDDGVKLWVNNRLIVRNWTNHGVVRNAGQIQLNAGQEYDICLEYFENTGQSVIKLLWSYGGNAEQTVPSSVLSPTSPTNISAKQAARFLMRATYGATPAEITRVQNIGYEKWLASQFDAPRTKNYYDIFLPRVQSGTFIGRTEMMREIGKKILEDDDQLRKRVAFALSEIMVVSFNDGDLEGNGIGIGAYLDMLERNAFGNYRQLLKDVTLHHAMGFYLDMLKNDKGNPAAGQNPNENYAREILQLFSVGEVRLNQDGTPTLNSNGEEIPNYGQDEIKGFAKVFTGWSYGGDTDNWYYPNVNVKWNLPMRLYPDFHSTDSKLLLNGTTLPPNQTGQQDLDAALNNIANHPSVAPFICKQLIQRLVTSNPSPQYIERVANVFNNNGAGRRGDLRAVVRAILLDSEAMNSDGTGAAALGKLREPIIRYFHLLRSTNALSDTGVYGFYGLETTTYGVGQGHFNSPSVFNFFAPDFAPQGEVSDSGLTAPEFQITTDTQLINSTNKMIYLIYEGGVPSSIGNTRMDFSLLNSRADNAENLTDTIETLFVPSGFTVETKQEMIDLINEFDANNRENRVKNALYLLIMTPDFAIEK